MRILVDSPAMSFAAPLFLWFFMPATLVAYWLLPRFRNGIVAVASLVFYAWGAGAYTLLLLSAIVVNYAAGRVLDRIERRRAAVLVAAVAWNLSILAVWKYAGFATGQLRALGLEGVPLVELALPIGISFFTFHHISYVVDVYRRSTPAQTSVVGFVTYIAMFPQLVAGPIVRYHEISGQLAKPVEGGLAAGFPRFALGLAKKVVIADSLAPIADAAFAPGAEMSTVTAWVGALAYTLQIYFDFSGYSDMAIGLGLMIGFRLPENFDRPYSAHSITDFWRRWHMSLSRWFRDYVYIPLGGNRHGPWKTYRNLLTVFVLCGLWHGADWTFLVWGLYHGVLLVAERVLRFRPGRLVTLLLVVFGWVVFRAESMPAAWRMLGAMVTWRPGPLDEFVAHAANPQRLAVFVLALVVVCLPGRPLGPLVATGPRPLRAAVTWLAAPYAALLVAAGTFSPFLYYQF